MIKTGVSLFAGIGGFDLAMQRAGIEVVATVEWDKHAQSVLTRRFPDTKLYGDITGVTGEQLINAGFDPANGIITGGFPCQDLSVAGRRAGLTGSRSGLFWEICRLLDETKAQNFILENVPGLLSSNEGRDMGTVVRALEERGYSVAWRVLDAQHFGVAQRRRRVFIIGHLGNDWRSLAEILAIGESSSRYSEQSNKKRKETSRIPSDGITDDNRAGNFELYDFPKEAISPTLNARRAHDTMTYQEVARMQGFGDYQMDEIAGALKARDHKDATDLVIDPTFFYAKNHQGVRIQSDVINTLAATMGTGGGNTPMVHAIQNTVIGRKDTSGPQGKGYGNEEDPMFTLDTTSPHAIAFHMTQTPVSGEISPTIGSSSNGMGMINRSVVRRLTPVECERLQGFPDNWTEGQADSHRYKQLGNAVAVPVVEWIIDRFIQATN
jgi:DNA (cytosine-5)-methyltransferase 1